MRKKIEPIDSSHISQNCLTPDRLSQGSNRVAGKTDDRLLTPEDIARITGLSPETLAQWRSQRRGIPFIKISRNVVRYRQVDLDRWLEERTIRAEHGPSVTERRN